MGMMGIGSDAVLLVPSAQRNAPSSLKGSTMRLTNLATAVEAHADGEPDGPGSGPLKLLFNLPSPSRARLAKAA
jgi:hypothetical protein